MDRLEAELGPSGYLVGKGFTVADLTAAALFTPVVAPPQRPFVPKTVPPAVLDLREELSGRSGGRWIHEMYARHRGQSAETREPATALAA
jgi:glutathione S-transferase